MTAVKARYGRLSPRRKVALVFVGMVLIWSATAIVTALLFDDKTLIFGINFLLGMVNGSIGMLLILDARP